MKKIAVIHNNFKEKFAIPRQSGLAGLKSTIVFEKEYRNPEAFRGLDGFSHIWLIWEFSKSKRENFSPTVRPPRLGGNKRMGVFATRSPFRPNPIGLSCVKMESIDFDCKDSPVITVSGADLLDGTPIYDIKPYLPYSDCIKDAVGGFTEMVEEKQLTVVLSKEFKNIDNNVLEELKQVLSFDPRPSYQNDSERVYAFDFNKYTVKFTVNDTALYVVEILEKSEEND